MKNITKKVKKIIVNGVTEIVRRYLKIRKVNLSKLSRETGIPYRTLYESVGDKSRKRELRVDEFLSICEVLELPVNTFEPNGEEEAG